MRAKSVLIFTASLLCSPQIFAADASGVTTATAAPCPILSGSGTVSDVNLIRRPADLQAMADNLGGHYVLCNDIDMQLLSGTFEPVGDSLDNAFTGILDGRGHTIGNLVVDTGNEGYAGLFGVTRFAKIRNLRLKNVSIRGRDRVGAVVGDAHDLTEIFRVEVSGTIHGTDIMVGGLVGMLWSSSVIDSRADVTVIGFRGVGGIAGNAYLNPSIIGTSSTGRVEVLVNPPFGGFAGGIVGSINDGIVTRSYSLSDVFGMDIDIGPMGGLIGLAIDTAISDCYARGDINGLAVDDRAAGLIGILRDDTVVADCHASGFIDAPLPRGLVGRYESETAVVSNTYWDVETSGTFESGAGEGRTTAQMTTVPPPPDTYVGWDFYDPALNPAGVWLHGPRLNDGYPHLR